MALYSPLSVSSPFLRPFSVSVCTAGSFATEGDAATAGLLAAVVGQIVLAHIAGLASGNRYSYNRKVQESELARIAGITSLPTHTECQLVFRSGRKASGLSVSGLWMLLARVAYCSPRCAVPIGNIYMLKDDSSQDSKTEAIHAIHRGSA